MFIYSFIHLFMKPVPEAKASKPAKGQESPETKASKPTTKQKTASRAGGLRSVGGSGQTGRVLQVGTWLHRTTALCAWTSAVF
jgi:hypothetical protein